MEMRDTASKLWIFAVALTAFGCAGTSTTEGVRPPDAEESRDDEGPRPYAEVVTAETTSDPGLFTVHRNGGDWLFEVPDSLLGRDMLLISRIAGVPTGFGGFAPAGVAAGRQLVRWERVDDRILLRRYEEGFVASDSLPIALSVRSNNFAPILASFPIEARTAADQGSVVDVTDFFSGDTPSLSGLSSEQRSDFEVRSQDEDRSYINYVRSFPRNVNVRHTLTYSAGAPPANARTGTISMEMHQSLVLLPSDPMRPRYADDRVGYFTVERVNFGLDEQKAATERFIRRWRLEPSDPAAYARGEVVDPVEPIVYYVDPATPERWRNAVRQGVENWQPVFETAGFSNAIIARDPPAPDEDPEWDPEDVRYSVVRWAASLTRNAQGPSTSDPRTGEIIESDIVWYHNHMRSYRNWMMVQTGAANPGARSLPISEELMAEAMEQVITHEIGHAIGLPHNMIASSAYPVDSLRSADFSRRMGVAPTIMDYARQNYIAQPEDGLEPLDFLRQVGPYDHHSVNWGYRVIPDAATPEEERSVLDQWIVERADDPMYRYLPQGGLGVTDPRAQTEDMGDDPVLASSYGMQNLRHIVPNLVAWTTRPGEDYTDLREVYGEALSQWNRYVGHVLNVVGGVHVDLKTADQEGPVYDGLPRARQEEAMDWLAREAFEAPTWLNDPRILELIGPEPAGLRALSARQASILNRLLDPERMAILSELETDDDDPYPLADFLDDTRDAVWGDVSEGAPVDAYRRALQRAYLERMAWLMSDDPDDGPSSDDADLTQLDVRPLVRAQLAALRTDAEEGARATADRLTEAHLMDVVARIDRILDRRAGGVDP
jgi:hypothetical protein